MCVLQKDSCTLVTFGIETHPLRFRKLDTTLRLQIDCTWQKILNDNVTDSTSPNSSKMKSCKLRLGLDIEGFSY